MVTFLCCSCSGTIPGWLSWTRPWKIWSKNKPLEKHQGRKESALLEGTFLLFFCFGFRPVWWRESIKGFSTICCVQPVYSCSSCNTSRNHGHVPSTSAPPLLFPVEAHPEFVKELLLILKTNSQPCLSFCCLVPEEQLHNIDEYDLNVVRLCFQAFLPDEHGNYTLALPPLISNPIYDNSKYQLKYVFFFHFFWGIPLLEMKNTRTDSEVLSSLVALGALFCFGTVRFTPKAWQRGWHPLKRWPQHEMLVHWGQNCPSLPWAHSLVLSQPSFTYAAMPARTGLLLTRRAVKIIMREMGAAKPICCAPEACLSHWGVLPLTREGSATELSRDTYLSGTLS